jgi:hypothetical protein
VISGYDVAIYQPKYPVLMPVLQAMNGAGTQ